MNRRVVLAQVALFVVITVGCGYYVATSVVGARTFGNEISVAVRMREAAGLSPGARITYRGVEVGTVADVRIREGGGVALRLSIDPGERIPADSEAVVTVDTPVGITHLDLRPRTRGAPYLSDSSTLTREDVTRPPPLEKILVDFMRLAKNLPSEDIATVTEAISTGLRGTGPELSRLLDNTAALLGSADERLGQLHSIASDARELVRSGRISGGRIRALAGSLRQLTGGLREVEPAVRKLLHQVPDAATKVTRLMKRSRSSVSTLLGNMVTTSRIVSIRRPALEQALRSLPGTLRKLASVVHGDTASFYLVASQGPVCYYETGRRSPTATDPREPRLDWHCPSGARLQQRGAAAAPRPDGTTRLSSERTTSEGNSRGGDTTHPRRPARAAQQLPFGIGTAGNHRVLGPRSWSSILLRGAK